MVMLVILVLGAITIFVSTLSSSARQTDRDKVTADALAKAKEALIGRAVSDLTSPGSLPCPDNTDSGSAGSPVGQPGNNCPSYIGRLPWKTLGLPDLRDGAGERLWYVLSPNFRDYVTSVPINSDNQGSFTVTGSVPASNVIAIVFAPGSVLSSQNQSRSSGNTIGCTTDGNTETENLCAKNYLEGSNANLSTQASPNLSYQSAASSSTFNDQEIIITHDQLFASVEMRIAREVKKCLDDYALVDGNKYPWAAPDVSYTGTFGTYFGWFPASPNTDTSAGGTGSSYSNPAAQTVADALNALQAALNAYQSNPTAGNRSALQSAANYVVGLRNSVPPVSSATIDTAGDYGNFYASGTTSYSTASSKVTSAFSALDSVYPPANSTPTTDASMPNTNWNGIATCNTLVSSQYWANWKQLVFYGVANGYQPGGGAGCATGSTCLKIDGSGNTATGSHDNYRAAVILARQAIGQARPSSSIMDYLEGSNTNPGSITPPTFVTYKPSDIPNYSSFNDLVLCLDGMVNCQ